MMNLLEALKTKFIRNKNHPIDDDATYTAVKIYRFRANIEGREMYYPLGTLQQVYDQAWIAAKNEEDAYNQLREMFSIDIDLFKSRFTIDVVEEKAWVKGDLITTEFFK